MSGDVEIPEAVELQGPGQAIELAAAAEAALSTSQPRACSPRAMATSRRCSLPPRLDSSSRRAGKSGGQGIEASKRRASRACMASVSRPPNAQEIGAHAL
jgi:hypothetical protein